MAASGFTPISLYFSTTAATAPSAANLVAGELALNTLDEKLYFKNSAGTVKLLASSAAVGTVTSVAQSFTGGIVSVAGSPITSSGTLALTVAGTSGGIPYFSSGTTWATSAALSAGAIVLGGGAGVTPATTTTGNGVVTALGVNTGSAGAFVVNGGDLGTPSAGVVTNLTGTASININGTVGATTPTSVSATTIVASNLLTQAAGANIASAATINLSTATGNGPRITGTTAISAVTMTTGQQVLIVADGALPLTYNATTNKLNSAAASVTLAAGDMVLYSKDLSGIVHGNIIKADGTSVVAAAAGTPISTPDVKLTGTSATFTIPSGVTKMKVTVIGGGGAGGGAGQYYCGCPCGPGYFPQSGAGGGSAGAAITYLTGLTPGNTLAYTVGAGGTANSNAAGGSGGTSSVVSGTQSITSITCTGGAGGTTAYTTNGGAGGTATGGTIGIDGSKGSSQGGGGGGVTLFGGAATTLDITRNPNTVGNTATGYGSGGGGATQGNPIATARVGGAGKAGIVIFEY